MITVQQFRSDFPAFGNGDRFPDGLISFWLQVANLLLNQDRWGLPAPFSETSVAVAAGGGGANYKVGDTITAGGGVSTQALVLVVSTVGAGGVVTAVSVQNPGMYTQFPPNPVLQAATSGTGTGAQFTVAWASAPYTAYDVGTELFVAHNLVLERKAQDDLDAGGTPGDVGPVASKSVGPVSISRETAASTMENYADFNMTPYGIRFARIADQMGMGPLIDAGSCPPLFSGQAFNGPITAQGILWNQ